MGDLTVTIGRSNEGRLTFDRPIVASDNSGYKRLPTLVEVPGLSARTVIEFESWGGGAAGFVAYFAEMAAAWRGWTGVKDWGDDGGTVQMSATHDGIGTITVRVTAMTLSGWEGPGAWRLVAYVALDPGLLDEASRALRHLVE
jgi:hypothetical protein